MARINWNEPRFDEDDIREVVEVIETAYVNEGPKSRELEGLIGKYLGVKHVVLVTNATAALFLAVKADAMIKGVKDFEVIVPDMTMIASATAVGWAGGRVVLADVERERMTIDIEDVKKKIGPKTTAIIPVHALGRAVNMDGLLKVAKENDLSVIEDAAGALGSKYGGKFLGAIGKVGCFSLQSNKIITSGQGGVIVTDDDEYYEMIRRLRDFGRFDKEFLHKIEGYNLKFNDLSAALGLGQFRKIDVRKAMLLEQRDRYVNGLSGMKEVVFPDVDVEGGEVPLWVDVVVENRDKLVGYLKSFDIHARACWPALHKNPAYSHLGEDKDFENACYFSDNGLWLPNGPAVSFDDIDLICDKVREFYKKEISLSKIHEDSRGGIYLMNDLLGGSKEFTFMEIKKGFARGGCVHSNDENFVVVSGRVQFICGDEERVVGEGFSGVIPAGAAHAFIALEDSIVSEWGITSEEKEMDNKDSKLRELVDKVNSSTK